MQRRIVSGPQDLDAAFQEIGLAIMISGPCMVNFSTMRDAAVDRIENALDIEVLSKWKGAGGGNCFFASTDAALMLLEDRLPFDLVTGRFDVDGEAIFHAWLEVGGPDPQAAERQRYVVNVSNMDQRPGYVIESGTYYQLNNCQEVMQRIGTERLRARIRRAGVSIPDRAKLRRFTRGLLGPTIAALSAATANH